jgi:hypothetical protein
MRVKFYKMRGLPETSDFRAPIDLELEFEGKRAFAVWESFQIGKYEFKARLEINPRLLKKLQTSNCSYLYRGELQIPRPQDN